MTAPSVDWTPKVQPNGVGGDFSPNGRLTGAQLPVFIEVSPPHASYSISSVSVQVEGNTFQPKVVSSVLSQQGPTPVYLQLDYVVMQHFSETPDFDTVILLHHHV